MTSTVKNTMCDDDHSVLEGSCGSLLTEDEKDTNTFISGHNYKTYTSVQSLILRVNS